MSRFGTEVWLYLNKDDEIVGFGSLGTTRWPWPIPDGPKARVAYIPQMAISLQFQRRPEGPFEQRFSCRIISDLLARAKRSGHEHVCLEVASENRLAIHLYERIGFVKADTIEKHGMHFE